jgi:hypothetical protein
MILHYSPRIILQTQVKIDHSLGKDSHSPVMTGFQFCDQLLLLEIFIKP